MIWRGFLIAGHIKPAITMTIFIVFFAMAMVSGGVDSIAANSGNLEEYNITKADLTFSPQIPDATAQDIDLEDWVESENIRVDDYEDVNNTQFSSEKVLRKDNISQEGWAIYRVDGDVEQINTVSRLYSFFHVGSQIELEEYQNPTNDTTPLETTLLSGRVSTNAQSSTNYVLLRIPARDSQSEEYVYSLSQQTAEDVGTFEALSRYVGSSATAITSWFSLLTGLPGVLFWLGVLFTIVGTIIVIEVVLW